MSETTLKKYIEYYETLSFENISLLRSLVTEDIFFKDPFNEVLGVREVEKVMQHMFESVEEPLFKVENYFYRDLDAFLKWVFSFNTKNGKKIEIVGLSELKFNKDGLIISHIDYWDAAEQFYEHIPILGSILRFLKKRLSVS